MRFVQIVPLPVKIKASCMLASACGNASLVGQLLDEQIAKHGGVVGDDALGFRQDFGLEGVLLGVAGAHYSWGTGEEGRGNRMWVGVGGARKREKEERRIRRGGGKNRQNQNKKSALSTLFVFWAR